MPINAADRIIPIDAERALHSTVERSLVPYTVVHVLRKWRACFWGSPNSTLQLTCIAKAIEGKGAYTIERET